jgi:CHAD domain-containing protein
MSPPGPPHPAEELVQTIRRCRRRYKKSLERCKEKFSEESVHKLRVETRRNLALLELLRHMAPSPPIQKLFHHFEKRLKIFGSLRDAHVQRQLFKPLWPRFPEARPLKRALERRGEKLAAEVARKIKAQECSGLNRRLKKVEQRVAKKCAAASPQAMRARAARVLEREFAGVCALQRQVREHQPSTIHALRVAFKRLRYLNELLRPVLKGISKSRVSQMQRFQDSAGAIQDLETARMRVARLVKHRKVSPANVRRLRHELQLQETAAAARFMRQLPQLNRFRPPSVVTSRSNAYEALHPPARGRRRAR